MKGSRKMLHYIGLVWNSADRDQSEAARVLGEKIAGRLPELQRVLRVNGMHVWWNAPKQFHDMYRLDEGNGVIFGNLFKREKAGTSSSRCAERIEASAGRTIVGSMGRALIGMYWGRYVAFLSDAGEDAKAVLRDPTGGVACM